MFFYTSIMCVALVGVFLFTAASLFHFFPPFIGIHPVPGFICAALCAAVGLFAACEVSQ